MHSRGVRYFVWEESFVCEWATHWRTGDPLPRKDILALRESKSMYAGLEMQQQLLYAALDQEYHRARPTRVDAAATGSASESSPAGGWDSTAIHRRVHERCLSPSLPWAEGTHWQSQFGHLVSYGGGYYSYLWSKMIAARIWNACFADDPLSLEMGEQLRRSMLSQGGARAPEDLLLELLGDVESEAGRQLQRRRRELGGEAASGSSTIVSAAALKPMVDEMTR